MDIPVQPHGGCYTNESSVHNGYFDSELLDDKHMIRNTPIQLRAGESWANDGLSWWSML